MLRSPRRAALRRTYTVRAPAAARARLHRRKAVQRRRRLARARQSHRRRRGTRGAVPRSEPIGLRIQMRAERVLGVRRGGRRRCHRGHGEMEHQLGAHSAQRRLLARYQRCRRRVLRRELPERHCRLCQPPARSWPLRDRRAALERARHESRQWRHQPAASARCRSLARLLVVGCRPVQERSDDRFRSLQRAVHEQQDPHGHHGYRESPRGDPWACWRDGCTINSSKGITDPGNQRECRHSSTRCARLAPSSWS